MYICETLICAVDHSLANRGHPQLRQPLPALGLELLGGWPANTRPVARGRQVGSRPTCDKFGLITSLPLPTRQAVLTLTKPGPGCAHVTGPTLGSPQPRPLASVPNRFHKTARPLTPLSYLFSRTEFQTPAHPRGIAESRRPMSATPIPDSCQPFALNRPPSLSPKALHQQTGATTGFNPFRRCQAHKSGTPRRSGVREKIPKQIVEFQSRRRSTASQIRTQSKPARLRPAAGPASRASPAPGRPPLHCSPQPRRLEIPFPDSAPTFARIKVTHLPMPSETFEQLLDRAASICGIEPGFWDIWGRYHQTTVEAKQALLRALGMDASGPAELERALARRTRAAWERLVAPVTVAAESAAAELSLHVPAECLGDTARITVTREDGETAEFHLNLWDLPQTGSIEMDGRTWVRKLARLPVALPLGYHQIAVRVGGASAETRYIVTPERACGRSPARARPRAPESPSACTASAPNATGDAAISATCWASSIGWRTIWKPVSSASIRCMPFTIAAHSTPAPTCRIASSIRISFTWMSKGWRISPAPPAPRVCAHPLRWKPKSAGCAKPRSSNTKAWPRSSCDFSSCCSCSFLREWRTGSPRAAAFNEFRVREGDLLEKFALYCALDEWLHRRDPKLWIWPDWPAEYRDPDSAATRAFRQKHWRSMMFYQYLQWQIGLQLQRAQRRARRPQDVDRPLPRSGVGHRPLRLRPVGPPPLLRVRLPRRLAARRFLPSAARTGASRLPTPKLTARRLPPVRRDHPP